MIGGQLSMKTNKILAVALLSIVALTSCDKGAYEPSYRFSDKDVTTTHRQARKGSIQSDLPATNSRVLVVPIEFADFPATDLLRGAEGAREDIEKAYFGESEDTQWESLKSYYYKSSYGKANITGQVMPWYRPKRPNSEEWFTTQAFATYFSDPNGATKSLISSIYSDYYINLYKDVRKDDGTAYADGKEFFRDYDADSDGFIDVIEMVYTPPFQLRIGGEEVDDDLFWAFRWSDGTTTANINRPSVCGFVWLSYHFLYENGYYDNEGEYHDWTDAQIIRGEAKIDTHTIIHETGHAFGADDYYTYDSNDWGALGGTDMMDYNIGDHNPYTKGLLGWSDPTVVVGETTINVKSFTDTGDAIMLPAHQENGEYNNTFLNEYLLIEYYRPTGLNAFDATHNYTGRYPKMPDIPGIRVYHVDARLGLHSYSSTAGWQFVRYVDIVTATDNNSYIGIANSNTKSQSAVPGNKLIHALEASGSNTLKTSSIARYTSIMMWQVGDTFGVDTFVDYELNSGAKLGYSFKILSMNDQEASIEFSLI